MCRAKMVDLGSKEDIKRLRGWVKKGKAWALEGLAGSYVHGIGVKQSDNKAIELYEMAAKRGNATAQYNLGQYYRRGDHGLTQSDQRAFEYYTLAAEQGYTDAQYNLAIMYANGNYVEQSDTRALELYKMAAKGGNAEAQFTTGVMYCNSTGVEQSYTKARKWLAKAAAQGHESAIDAIKQLDAAGV